MLGAPAAPPLQFTPGIEHTVEDILQRLCTLGSPSLGYAACTPNPVALLPTIPDRINKTGNEIQSVAWARGGGNVTTGDGDGYVWS